MKKSILLLLVLSVLLLFSCENGPGSKDEIIAPTCSFCADVPDTIQLGDEVLITIDAEDVDGKVARADFELDGTFLMSDSVAPYSYTWKTKGADIGGHTFKATVFDNDGNTAEATKSVVIDKKPREWTIIGYFDGNNNLDNAQSGTSFIIEDLQEMELAGSSDEVTSLVMLGSRKKGGNVGYYEIEKNENQLPDEILSPLKEDLGTKDMSDPESLKEFIRWCTENYPAKRYALIINSHGAAWNGMCPDDVNGSGDHMSMPEFKSAIENAPYFEVIVFHSCLMGSVEVAYEIRNNARYMVASEASMPSQSILGADVWLAELINAPQMESYGLSKRIAQCVYDKGVIAQWDQTHMAVTDLTQLTSLGSKISELGTKILNNVGNNWDEVWDAWGATHYISDSYPSLTDLREFNKQLLKMEDISNTTLIKNATDELLTTINKAVPFTKSNSTNKKYGGLSIHFPGNSNELDLTNYAQLDFNRTNWHSFLDKFIYSNKIYFQGNVSWAGHDLCDNCKLYVFEKDGGENKYLGYVSVENDGNYSFSINTNSNDIYIQIIAHDDLDDDFKYDIGEGYCFWNGKNTNSNEYFKATRSSTYSVDFYLKTIQYSTSAGSCFNFGFSEKFNAKRIELK